MLALRGLVCPAGRAVASAESESRSSGHQRDIVHGSYGNQYLRVRPGSRRLRPVALASAVPGGTGPPSLAGRPGRDPGYVPVLPGTPAAGSIESTCPVRLARALPE